MHILALPPELLSNILSFLRPQSIVRFGQSCRLARDLVKPPNPILWRAAFLHVFDDPQDALAFLPEPSRRAQDAQWDWYAELVRRLRALRAIRSKWCTVDDPDRCEDHLRALLSILDTAKSTPTARDLAHGRVPAPDDRTLSLNMQIFADLDWYRDGLENLIHDARRSPTDKTPAPTPALDRVGSPGRPVTRSVAQLEHETNRPEVASRLHVLYGLTVRERIEHRARGAARRKVYDWSLSCDDNDYGPFRRDGSGRVDWVLLEAVHSVIARNFAMCVEGAISVPHGFCFSIPHRTLRDPTVPDDWARVTGPWLGTYSFLDYADLFAFNTWETRLGSRPTLDDEPEACGDLMKLELKLDQSLAGDSQLKTQLPISSACPVLYFVGLSRAHVGIHRPAIGVRGCVSLLPGEREVRWRFIIAYGGQDQWQLEGVQPGGIRSGGIYGLWSQCDHEENGPVGPFCYFPMELCKPTSIVLMA